MSTHHGVGIGHAASYQVSGHPWLTGSYIDVGTEVKLEFPFVTKSITILNTGSNTLRVHFDTKSNTLVYDNNHYITLTSNSSFTYDVKCREIYVSNSSSGGTGIEVYAELTRIDKNRMYQLTGSGINI